MITEYGVVTKANPSSAWVKTNRTAACESCASRKDCGGHGITEMTVVVKNNLGVKQGDQVVIGIESSPMMFLAFLLYVFPILFLVIGALAGNALAPVFSMDPSLCALITGGTGFGIAFVIIRINHSRLSRKDKYKPFLVRKGAPPSQSCQAAQQA